MSPLKNPLLHRYWIEFQREPTRPPGRAWPPLACGVTAYTREDALTLVQQQVYRDQPVPPVSRVVEDIDLSRLDTIWRPYLGVPLHQVLADVSRATPVWRGVWYPFDGYGLR